MHNLIQESSIISVEEKELVKYVGQNNPIITNKTDTFSKSGIIRNYTCQNGKYFLNIENRDVWTKREAGSF